MRRSAHGPPGIDIFEMRGRLCFFHEGAIGIFEMVRFVPV